MKNPIIRIYHHFKYLDNRKEVKRWKKEQKRILPVSDNNSDDDFLEIVRNDLDIKCKESNLQIITWYNRCFILLEDGSVSRSDILYITRRAIYLIKPFWGFGGTYGFANAGSKSHRRVPYWDMSVTDNTNLPNPCIINEDFGTIIKRAIQNREIPIISIVVVPNSFSFGTDTITTEGPLTDFIFPTYVRHISKYFDVIKEYENSLPLSNVDIASQMQDLFKDNIKAYDKYIKQSEEPYVIPWEKYL